jgi:4-hydroxy-4-methyl-2-oxoglutarate aldolase
MQQKVVIAIALAGLGLVSQAFGQLGMWTTEQRTEFTREWEGERFPDGRPKVSDETVQRLSKITAEEAWGTLRGKGFTHQFEGNWQVVNPGEKRLAGRVVTAVFMPKRPDVEAVINDFGKKEKRVSRGQNSWVIDTLKPGDVLVVDMFGKIKDGTFAGDNLATAIYAKSGTGLIVEGGVRDVSGMQTINGFRAYIRGADPSAIKDVTLMGINVPIRIGDVTVMPGDIVVSDPEGLTFIPPQLAKLVADRGELTQARDKWGHQMLRDGTYTPGQIDTRWSEQMVDEFNQWAEQQGYQVKMPKPKANQ